MMLDIRATEKHAKSLDLSELRAAYEGAQAACIKTGGEEGFDYEADRAAVYREEIVRRGETIRLER